MKGKRYFFVDLFRGWAVLFMVETHVVNAWMDAGLRSSTWFSYLNLLNGFVAPSFLFIAGVSFAIVSKTKWKEMTTLSKPLARQVRRLLMILGIGYLLHFPRIEWVGLVPRIFQEDLKDFYQVDILQTIAVSLLVLHVLQYVIRQRTALIGMVTVVTLAALFFTPIIWKIDFSSTLHPALANYLNGLHNPLFPLFPWSVFLLAGSIAGFFFLDNAEYDREPRAIAALSVCGGLLFVLAWIADRIPFTFFEYDSFWLTSPNWVLMRLGILLVIFSLFWILEIKGWHKSKAVLVIGSQSLFAYVLHLWLIYSITGEKSSLHLFDQNNPIWLTLLLLVFLLIVVYYLTVGWGLLKKTLKNRKRSIEIG